MKRWLTNRLYILSSNSQLLGKHSIDRNDFSNTSAHTSIKFYINRIPYVHSGLKQDSYRNEKKIWDSGDIAMYQQKLAQNFKNISHISSDIDTAISNVTQIIKKSTKSAFPTKVMKLKGPKYKFSKATLALVKESKQTLRAWRNAGSPRGEHLFFKQKKKLKRLVRKQNRRERAIDKSRFYSKLMASPDTSYFFKLTKRNTGKANTRTQTTLLHNNLEIDDPSSQTETFAEHYEQLAVPENNPSFNGEFLDLCTFRCSLIQ